jgi:hypothetical protein
VYELARHQQIQERVPDLTDGRVGYTAPLRDRVVPPSRPYRPLWRAGLGQQVGDGRKDIRRKGMSYSEMMQIPVACVSTSTSLGESSSPAMPITTQSIVRCRLTLIQLRCRPAT